MVRMFSAVYDHPYSFLSKFGSDLPNLLSLQAQVSFIHQLSQSFLFTTSNGGFIAHTYMYLFMTVSIILCWVLVSLIVTLFDGTWYPCIFTMSRTYSFCANARLDWSSTHVYIPTTPERLLWEPSITPGSCQG